MMLTRTTYKPATFTRPFLLRGIDEVQPAGTYTVETDEELMDGLSFSAYRRVTTVIFLPARQGGAGACQVATIDPLELEAAQREDAMADQNRAHAWLPNSRRIARHQTQESIPERTP